MGRVSFDGYFVRNIYLNIGGIVGEVGSYGSSLVVRNCVNYGTVAFTGSADFVSSGGIVGTNVLELGESTLATKIYNCLNYGYIVQSGNAREDQRVGGIIGRVGSGYAEIDNVVNFGYISVNPSAKYKIYVGTIAGFISRTKLTNSYWAAGSTYDVAGSIYETSTVTQCTNFSAQTFTLMKNVKVGKYSGNSLLGALNAGADSHSSLKYSKWLLNKNNNAVTFAVNGEAPFFKVSTQLILMPTLADGVSKKFSGWYTNSACTTKVTNFEISVDTNLYGKFA